MSLFVIYGFDTASTLAEETKDPRREAPKAVIGSIVGALIIGAVFLWGTLMAVPDMAKAAPSLATGPQTIIEENFSSAIATVYLLIVSAAIFVCCMSIMTSTVRLCFGMSRDDQLPLSRTLSRVNPKLHTPIWSCVAVALLAAVPFIEFAGATVVAVSATAMIYLSYFLGNIAILRARLKGWPRVKAPFSLGRWGIPINILGLCWGGGMLINFLWYSNNKAFDLRQLTNPKATQTDYFGTGPLVHFFGFLNKIPVIELIMVVVIVVGAVYYYAVQRNKPYTPPTIPEEGALGTPAAATG
jgi:amino acid transporter